MKKVRINELARELEVKPGVIIDLLPELGVHEKKTHSSSVDEEVALELRRRFGRGNESPGAESRDESVSKPSPEIADTSNRPSTPLDEEIAGPAEEISPAQPVASERQHATVRPALGEPLRAHGSPAPPPAVPTPAPAAIETPQPALEAAGASMSSGNPSAGTGPSLDAVSEQDRAIPAFRPLRPPIGGGAIHPPLAHQSSQTHTPGLVNRTIAIPAKPAPTLPLKTRPSMPVAPPTGPRQPLPPETPRPVLGERMARTGPVAEVQAPAAPQPPLPRAPLPPTHVVAPGPSSPPASSPAVPGAPAPPRQGVPRPSTGLTPGAPIAPRPPASRPALAGQPAARPVVPPRQDILQRLNKQPARPGQAASPAAPRPGSPARPSPAPGQPLYRGPIRPGQPIVRPGGPGFPAQPGQRRPGGLRPLHPTALRPEPATVPTEQQRRHQAKPGARGPIRKREDLEEGNLRQRSSKRPTIAEPPPIDREITVSEGISVKELSEKLGVKANLVIKKLVERKIFATINQTLDVKLAEELARDFGASTNQVSYEEESIQDIGLPEAPTNMVRRAPVVTIMGHVDHGKTSLLDAIRQTNVAGREAGGITQHIGAYYIEKNGRKIVFIDTPGHQAFTRMRARGAKVTDIVVLVVSADDGVMPQTLEAIDHARAAKVPILVAINKIDKPDAQPERVKQQLADRGLLAEDWGGDVVMVPVSAKKGENLDLLLEMILLVADLQDLKANPDRPAVGTVLEAKLDKGRGPVATMLVRNGTLRVGDFFICGALFNKVRAMFDDRGNPVKEAEPSMPVEVIGLESLPEVGDTFQVVSDTSKAKQIVVYREAKARDVAMAKGARVATLASLNEQFKEGQLKELNLVIKADVGGTAEVLSDTLQQLSNEKVRVRVLRTGVGAITEDDVLLASASDALIIGFNVRPERNALATAEQQKVDIRLHSIIYELIDEVQRAMTGLLEPVYKETIQGHAEVRETFKISKVGTVAGCYVSDGVVRRDSQVRVLRNGDVVHTGRMEALKRFKNDASEVKNGLECGISLANFNNVQVGDVLEAFTMERIAAELPPALVQ